VKDRLDLAMGVSNWRFHDLRRTAASGMARLGVAPHVIEKVLNHISGQISGVAAVYNRHGYDKEKREALNRWANHLAPLRIQKGFSTACGRPFRSVSATITSSISATQQM
jgi:integrase